MMIHLEISCIYTSFLPSSLRFGKNRSKEFMLLNSERKQLFFLLEGNARNSAEFYTVFFTNLDYIKLNGADVVLILTDFYVYLYYFSQLSGRIKKSKQSINVLQ